MKIRRPRYIFIGTSEIGGVLKKQSANITNEQKYNFFFTSFVTCSGYPYAPNHGSKPR